MAITRTVTVAAGRFAAGQLGGLTPFLPFELVDAVLEETRAVQQRLRDLPSRVGVYFLVAMCLFPEVGYRLVWDKLTAGIGGCLPGPSAKGLRDLRRRVGCAPVKALFEVVAGVLAPPRTPGVRFGPYRTVSFDGCSSIKTPDSERNRGWLRRCPHGGYPQVELMTLVETGTRSVIGAVFGPTRESETSYATRLLSHLGPEMPLLWDRGFDSNDFLAAVHATGARVVGRIRQCRRPPVLEDPHGFLPPLGRRRSRRAHHRGRRTSHLRRRQHLQRLLPSGDHPAGRPALPRRPSRAPLPRTLGTRERLLRAASHHSARPGPALVRPGRRRAGDVGPAAVLPAPAPRHHRGSGVPAGHRS
ncbi:transposase domain-containing protein [Streptosporangium sp. NBC_01495]|uniref:transposase domain-containing protein n=1 Tax=Streptosporangium sp. NBC_01495 TaxID=2903899 RepID=UPI003FCD7C00